MAIIGQDKLLMGRHVVALEPKGHEAGVILEDATVQIYRGLQQAPTRWVLLRPALLPIRTCKERSKPKVLSVFHASVFLTF